MTGADKFACAVFRSAGLQAINTTVAPRTKPIPASPIRAVYLDYVSRALAISQSKRSCVLHVVVYYFCIIIVYSIDFVLFVCWCAAEQCESVLGLRQISHLLVHKRAHSLTLFPGARLAAGYTLGGTFNVSVFVYN